MYLFQQSFQGLISLMDTFHRGIYRIVLAEVIAISTGIELAGWLYAQFAFFVLEMLVTYQQV
jgi:hypothetical protein